MNEQKEDKRYIFRVYNIPVDSQRLKTLLDQLTIPYKNIWVATPPDNYPLTWAWIEFDKEDDLKMAKIYLDGMKWCKQTVRVFV